LECVVEGKRKAKAKAKRRIAARTKFAAKGERLYRLSRGTETITILGDIVCQRDSMTTAHA